MSCECGPTWVSIPADQRCCVIFFGFFFVCLFLTFLLLFVLVSQFFTRDLSRLSSARLSFSFSSSSCPRRPSSFVRETERDARRCLEGEWPWNCGAVPAPSLTIVHLSWSWCWSCGVLLCCVVLQCRAVGVLEFAFSPCEIFVRYTWETRATFVGIVGKRI